MRFEVKKADVLNFFIMVLIILFFNIIIFIFKVAMRALGFEVKKADVLKVLHEYDRSETGMITFEDFNECS